MGSDICSVLRLMVFLMVGQMALAQVEDAVACGSCCTQMNTKFDTGSGPKENVFNLFTCQARGCVVGNDCSDLPNPFDRKGCEIGESFRLSGSVTLPEGEDLDPDRVFFCSTGGELSVVEYTDSTHSALLNANDQCFACCNDLNRQFDFDTNDGYSVQACRERCRGQSDIPSTFPDIDVFDEASNTCVKDEDDDIGGKPKNFFFNGCVIGTEFLEQGFVDFKGIRHYCETERRNDGQFHRAFVESVGAVLAEVESDDRVGRADNDCARCCGSLDAELDDIGNSSDTYNVEACKEDGCHANQFCEVLVGSDKAGCEIGKEFLKKGKVSFGGQDVLCQKGGVVKGAVVDVNEVIEQQLVNNNANEAEQIGIGAGSALGAVALLAGLAYFANRSGREASKSIMAPIPRDYAFSEDQRSSAGGAYYGGGSYSLSPNQ